MSRPGCSHRQCTLSADELATVFSYLSEEERDQVCCFVEPRLYQKGSIVMQEGERADCMAFVAGGRLAVKKAASFAGRHILVAILEQGAMVGEMSVLERSQRAATVTAEEESRLLILTTDRFEALLAEAPALGVKLLKRILHVVSMRIRQADDRLSKLL